MKSIKEKHFKIASIFFIVFICTIILSFPEIRSSIPIYASKEIVDWMDLVIIPIILALTTSGLLTVWFNYKLEKERMIDGLRRELDILSQYNFELVNKIISISNNPFSSENVKNSQIIMLFAYKTENYFLRHEYPDLCQYVWGRYSGLSKVIKSNNINSKLPTLVIEVTEVNEEINKVYKIFNDEYVLIKTQ